MVPGRLGRLGRLAQCPVGRGCEYRDGGAETRRPFAGESELGCKSVMSRLVRQDQAVIYRDEIVNAEPWEQIGDPVICRPLLPPLVPSSATSKGLRGLQWLGGL